MSTILEGIAKFLGLAPDAPPEDVEEAFRKKLAADAEDGKKGADGGEETDTKGESNSDATDDPNYRKLADELAAERKEREKLASQLAEERAARERERHDAEADALLAELRSDGFITPAQEQQLQPVARKLAQDTELLGEGDDAVTPLKQFAEAIRAGGPVVRLGHESTSMSDDEEKTVAETVARMAQFAGVDEKSD